MVFNPEDEQDFGPHCRNCHRGSSRCSTCHYDSGASNGGAWQPSLALAADNTKSPSSGGANRGGSTFHLSRIADGAANPIGSRLNMVWSGTQGQGFYKKSRTANWDNDWRTTTTALGASYVNTICSDDGFSWPHRTLGWKMLKDDLFGLDFDNNTWVGPGETRTYPGTSDTLVAHDIDSVCLDCHNPNVWNDGQKASNAGHVDTTSTTTDDHNDELLTRGLP